MPAVVVAPGATVLERIAWIAEHTSELSRRLLEHGAIRFSELGADTVEAFDRLTDVFFDAPAAYVGGDARRSRVSAKAYTSSEMAAELPIALHNELCYTSRWPAQLLFGCLIAADDGGETPIADCRRILQALDPAIVAEFTRRGVRYTRNLHGGDGFGRSWQETFETCDRDAVEAICLDMEIAPHWKPDGGMRLVQQRPAIGVHPVTGESVWFNQAESYHPSTIPKPLFESLLRVYGDDVEELPRYSAFGDGGAFALDMLEAIRGTVASQTVARAWLPGDALWIDNMLVSHGRAPYKGHRRVMVSMA